ncbi:hypothetical protein [Jiangella endophytica]|uniref:hypothetical protein n=1 Tax=Jiangella endophytica TaxID=1623398 RepID=UPI000E34EBEC|nr:hypothetical protein [Jiangella endophytica]
MTDGDEPLDLGVVRGGQDREPPADPGDRPGRPGKRSALRRWAAVAAAFVVGGVLGLVVADARDDAAGYADVRLVGGAIQGMSDHADETAPGFLEISLLNLGEHEVEILGLEPHGMTVAAADEPAEPLRAPPGEWVTARQDRLIADCAGPSRDGLRVRVRDAGGTQRVVEADTLPEFGGVAGLVDYVCRPVDLVFPAIGATIVSRESGSVTMELRVANDGTGPLPVSAFEPDTPGMVATGPEVPFEVPAAGSISVPLTWTVTDCRLATGWPGVQIAYTVGADGQSRGHYQLDGTARAELVLLVDRVCGSGS